MKIALMTFEGELYKEVEWSGKTEHNGMYLRFPGQEYDHFNTVLAIRTEDVNEYLVRVRDYKNKIANLQNEMNQFKASMHHKLIPFENK